MPDEGLSRIDSDRSQEHGKAKISQDDVGRQGHGPEHGTGAAQLAQNKGDDQWTAPDTEGDNPDARDGNRKWTRAVTPRTMPIPSDT